MVKNILILSLAITLSSCGGGGSSSGNNTSSGSSQNIPNNAPDIRAEVLAGREQTSFRRVGDVEVRTVDAHGNNIANPTWGASFIALQRLAPANYSDGVSDLAGATRPSAREVSNNIHHQYEGENIPNEFGTSDFLWQWGQFLDHDMDLTDGVEGSRAFDITVPAGDHYFDPQGLGDKVITFNRARYVDGTGTSTTNPRQQENEITAFIDGNNIYGSDQERLNFLREGAFLKASPGKLLQFNTDSLTNANGPIANPESLFVAGDVRANEQVGLTVMHTLFMREHNRLVTELIAEDPNRTEDEIFEQAKRLLVAKLQIITYNEFLPALIGPTAIPPYTGYNPRVNPGIFNEFSVAAFRLGHSMLNAQLARLNADGSSVGNVELRQAFFTAPSFLQAQDDIDPFLRGLASQLHQKIDVKIISDVRNFLFGQPGSFGLDLASLNVQRGRDHGVSSYNDTRAALGLTRVSNFSEITSDPTLQSKLERTFGSVNNIDLWTGGLAEDPQTKYNSQVGQLFRRILVLQFIAIRDGDRFWYESYLSEDELNQVRGTTLSQIIKANTSIGSELQDNVFYVR